jgi:hypothetical protein
MFARVLVVCLMVFGQCAAHADELRSDKQLTRTLSEADRQSKFQYQMFCQGCHSPDGLGYKSVPTLKGSMHRFMMTEQGRSYLVQVPGAAYSPLNDEDLAQLLNWMLLEFSDHSQTNNKTAAWEPYTKQEVSEYRKSPLFETVDYRELVLKNLPQN